MITEAIITAVYNAISSFLSTIMGQVWEIAGKPVGFQIQVPTPFWFIFTDITAQLLVILPLAFAWWIWRGIKA